MLWQSWELTINRMRRGLQRPKTDDEICQEERTCAANCKKFWSKPYHVWWHLKGTFHQRFCLIDLWMQWRSYTAWTWSAVWAKSGLSIDLSPHLNCMLKRLTSPLVRWLLTPYCIMFVVWLYIVCFVWRVCSQVQCLVTEFGILNLLSNYGNLAWRLNKADIVERYNSRMCLYSMLETGICTRNKNWYHR